MTKEDILNEFLVDTDDGFGVDGEEDLDVIDESFEILTGLVVMSALETLSL